MFKRITSLTALLPQAHGLKLEYTDIQEHTLTLTLRTTTPEAACPTCATPSFTVHSRYTRTVRDLPGGGYAVRLLLRVRKFFCRVVGCAQRIFTERIPTVVAPPARMTTRLHEILRRPAERSSEALMALDQMRQLHADIGHLIDLSARSAERLRERQDDAFDGWMADAHASQLAEVRQCARHVRTDEAAVRAARQDEWSNGQTEGQVHRLKLIKRRMYGRAKFDLLRQRVLHAV